MRTEQRKDIRFLVEDNAIVALRDGSTKIGRVKDISRGGFSFEHIYEDDSNWGPSRKDLFLWVNEFSMSKVPCRVMYDIPAPMPTEYQLFRIRLITRRCGVQFEALSENQMAQLDLFLKTYTKGTAP